MRVFEYKLDQSVDERPRIGLITLQADETIERVFFRDLSDLNANIHVTRVPSGDEVTLDTLARMQRDLPFAAGLFPAGQPFDVIAYGCTSGTSTIGADVVAEMVRRGAPSRFVTDPLTATIAWCHAHNVKKLAVLSPYVAEVNVSLRESFGAAGIQTDLFGTFNVADEAKVARISNASIVSAAAELCAQGQPDALFLSCTNLRASCVLSEVSEKTGLKVGSSNSILCWHIRHLLENAD